MRIRCLQLKLISFILKLISLVIGCCDQFLPAGRWGLLARMNFFLWQMGWALWVCCFGLTPPGIPRDVLLPLWVDIKTSAQILVYVHTRLQSRRTCRAFWKMKHPHLWAFHFLKCSAFFFCDIRWIPARYNGGKLIKIVDFTLCNALGHRHYWNQAHLAQAQGFC